MKVRAPLFVGELNPYGSSLEYALFCEPPHSAGGRLCRLVCGLRRSTYLKLDRVNLCSGKWRAVDARACAGMAFEGSLGSHSHRVIVMLGRKVADAFRTSIRGIAWDFKPFTYHVFACDQLTFVALPHPSGLCRAWHEQGAFVHARALLREVCPEVPWGEAFEDESSPIVTCVHCQSDPDASTPCPCAHAPCIHHKGTK